MKQGPGLVTRLTRMTTPFPPLTEILDQAAEQQRTISYAMMDDPHVFFVNTILRELCMHRVDAEVHKLLCDYGAAYPEAPVASLFRVFEHKVADNLYYQYKECLSYEKLVELVPEFAAADAAQPHQQRYSKTRVIIVYMGMMEQVKPRGKEWNVKRIELIKSL